MNRIIVGISGASGVIYGIRLLEILKETGITSHLIMTSSAEIAVAHETDWKVEDVKKMSSKINHLESRLNKGYGFGLGVLIILSIAISGLNSFWTTWFR